MNLNTLESIETPHRRSVEARRGPASDASALSTVNFILAAAHVSANLFQLFILPVYFLPKTIWWSVVLIPMAALNNPLWALIHEAIHDLLNSSGRRNTAAGRLLSIF